MDKVNENLRLLDPTPMASLRCSFASLLDRAGSRGKRRSHEKGNDFTVRSGFSGSFQVGMWAEFHRKQVQSFNNASVRYLTLEHAREMFNALG